MKHLQIGNNITIAGQITTNANLKIEELVREKIKQIGYDNENTDMDYRTCKIDIDIIKQSPDIAMRSKYRWSWRSGDYVWVCK